jgi:hypothetical protein
MGMMRLGLLEILSVKVNGKELDDRTSKECYQFSVPIPNNME